MGKISGPGPGRRCSLITEAEIAAARDEALADSGWMNGGGIPFGPFMALAEICLTQVVEVEGLSHEYTLSVLVANLRVAFEVGMRVGRKQATTELTKVGGEEGAG